MSLRPMLSFQIRCDACGNGFESNAMPLQVINRKQTTKLVMGDIRVPALPEDWQEIGDKDVCDECLAKYDAVASKKKAKK